MPLVRYVNFYPPVAWPDRAWHRDPACDALVKSSRRVAESYGAAILERRLQGKAGEVRVFARPAPPEQEEVTVDVHLDFGETFETAGVQVPASVASIGADARARLSLDVLDGVVRALAPERGWDLDDLDRAAAQVARSGGEFTWSGPWTSSPDRRREARGTFWLEDHGHGTAVVEVRDRGADEARIVRSPPAGAGCTAPGFVRSAKTLRWEKDAVVMTPAEGLGRREPGEIRWSPSSGDAGAVVGRQDDPDDPAVPVPRVVVTTSRRVPQTDEIRYVGGGPTNGVPEAYQQALRRLLHRLEQIGVPWWSAADRTLLEITYSITEDRSGVAVRRLADRVAAEIRRPLTTFGTAHPRQLAGEDVRALLDAVSRRMGLGEAPDVWADRPASADPT